MTPYSIAERSKPTTAGTVRPLLPHHLEDLRKSGLTDETIQAAGIYSETNHHKIAAILNRKTWQKKNGAALVFQFFDENKTVVLQRVKPDRPPKRGGKPGPKYLSPTGSTPRTYVPPSINGELTDTSHSLVLTEGEKKSLSATQHGFPTVGLCGVDSWHPKRSSTLLPDLERIAWKGRKVFIAFDSDADTNPNIKENENLLADALKNRGAIVKVVRIPSGPDGAKQGLDDFLVAHGADELHKLINAAEDPEPPEPGSVKRPASEMLPEIEAARYLDAGKKDGRRRLMFSNESWLWWNRGQYREMRDSEVRAHTVRFLNRDYTGVGRQAVGSVMEQLRAQACLPSHVKPPTWLDDVPGSDWPGHELLVTPNAIIHLPSLFSGDEWQVPPTPALFNMTATEVKFVPADKCPKPDRWLRFLNELWEDDRESITALQLWCGYCLVSDLRQHKFLAMFGPARSGKGTIARILRLLVGVGNVAAPTLSSLSMNFGLWPLLDKTLAIIGDARLSGRQDSAVIVERILSITGEDALTIDRKYAIPVTTTLPTRIMLLSNELPRLPDASGTLASRMIVMQLTKSWFGKEDKNLTHDLSEELPSILWWAIDGYRQLHERGSLIQPSSGAESVTELEDLTSPTKAFLRECCMIGPEHSIARSDLFEAYEGWAKEEGRKHVLDAIGLGKDLHAAIPGLRTRSVRAGAHRSRRYVGVTLKNGDFGG